MKVEKFEYYNNDIPVLKKDLVVRAFFCVTFFALTLWQVYNIVRQYKIGMTWLHSVLGYTSLVISLFLAIASLGYIVKNTDIIKDINKNGSTIRSIEIAIETKKDSVFYIYYIISKVLTLVFTLILLSAVTYAILQYVYFETFSYYLPVIAISCVSGYHTVYHYFYELNTFKTIKIATIY